MKKSLSVLICPTLLLLGSFILGCTSTTTSTQSVQEKTEKPGQIIQTISDALASSGRETKTADMNQTVKVFIMMGQSNMVGMGKINGRSERLGKQHISEAVACVYEGDYDPAKDYDKLEPIQMQNIVEFGGKSPEPLPGGGTVVVRGKITMKPDTYLFNMGYGDSAQSLFEIDGKEVYRKEVGQKNPTRSPFTSEEGKSYTFRFTFFTKNASALGWFEPTFVPGSLVSIVKAGGKFPFLLNDKGDWAERSDVYYYDARTKGKCGPLNPLSNGGKVGPELGFGFVVGDALEEPVLLLKSCIGNRSLGWDLLPPDSPQYEHNGQIYAGYKQSPLSWEKGTEPTPIEWYAGKQWDIDIENAKLALAKIGELYPGAKGYEVAGFVWWQGDKDRYNEGHAIRYERNLTHLIKTLRKEFNAPEAKFVLATLGQTPREGGDHPNEQLIIDAMFAVDGKSGKYPEFKGNVSTVYTHPISKGGASNGHYDGNAETYVNVGLALGQAMRELLGK